MLDFKNQSCGGQLACSFLTWVVTIHPPVTRLSRQGTRANDDTASKNRLGG